MRYSYPLSLISQEEKSVDDLAGDEIDRFFTRLQRLEPPKILMPCILRSITHLARPMNEKDIWKDLDGLVVRNEKSRLC